jgi:hypothetical protein
VSELKLEGIDISVVSMEKIRTSLKMTQFDFGWLVGLDHAKYNRILNGKTLLGYAEKGLIRYINYYFDGYPYNYVLSSDSSGADLVSTIQAITKPITLNEIEVDVHHYGGLGALLFKSKSVARSYALGINSPTLSGTRWAKVLIHCLKSESKGHVVRVIEEEIAVNKTPTNIILENGW